MKMVLANPKKYEVHPAVKYADSNVGQGQGFITLPLYALGFMKTQEKDSRFPQIDVNPELPDT